MRRHTPVALFVVLLAAAALLLATSYPRLPDMVPTHFGADGQPDDWSSRGQFAVLYVVLVFGLGGLFAGLGYLVRHVPVSLMNLPNKDYWFAPERRDATLRRLVVDMLWFADALIAFMVATMHQSIRVAMGASEGLGKSFWVTFWAFMAFTLLWTVALYWRFRRPRQK